MKKVKLPFQWIYKNKVHEQGQTVTITDDEFKEYSKKLKFKELREQPKPKINSNKPVKKNLKKKK